MDTYRISSAITSFSSAHVTKTSFTLARAALAFPPGIPIPFATTSISLALKILLLSEERINQGGPAKIGRDDVSRIGFQGKDGRCFGALLFDDIQRGKMKLCQKRYNRDTNPIFFSVFSSSSLTSKGSEA